MTTKMTTKVGEEILSFVKSHDGCKWIDILCLGGNDFVLESDRVLVTINHLIRIGKIIGVMDDSGCRRYHAI